MSDLNNHLLNNTISLTDLNSKLANLGNDYQKHVTANQSIHDYNQGKMNQMNQLKSKQDELTKKMNEHRSNYIDKPNTAEVNFQDDIPNEDNLDIKNAINTRLDNFLFENPGARLPSLNEIQYNNNDNIGLNYKPKVQNRSKSLYKSQANERLIQHSPLSRPAYYPINTNMNTNRTKQQTPRDLMNSRLNNLTPLSCNLTLPNQSKDNKNLTASRKQDIDNFNSIPKPNFSDVNPKNSNVVYEDMPVMTT